MCLLFSKVFHGSSKAEVRDDVHPEQEPDGNELICGGAEQQVKQVDLTSAL